MRELFCAVLFFCGVAFGQEPATYDYCAAAPTGLPPLPASVVQPTLPKLCPNVVFPTGLAAVPFTGTTLAQLQTAVNALACGHNLMIPPSVSVSGTLNIPGTVCPTNSPILISTSAISALPSPGVLVQLSEVTNMPTIASSNTNSALTFCQAPACATAPSNWYFTGINFTTNNVGTPGAPNNAIITLSVGATAMSQEPSNITFDRVLVQGNGMTTRGFYADAHNFALVNSQVVGMVDTSQDTQAVLLCDTTGPALISNNHLEATGENIMAGGCGTGLLPPSDITITRNYLHKQPGWAGLKFVANSATPVSTGTLQYDIKDNMECKDCVRVLVDSNIADYAVPQGQGACISNNSFLQAPPSAGWVDQDITYTNNLCDNSWGGAYVAANNQTSAASTSRIMFRNNIFSGPNLSGCFTIAAGNGGGGTSNITWDHNTCTNKSGALVYGETTQQIPLDQYFTCTNNIGFWSFVVDGYNAGAALTYLPATAVYLNNLQVGDTTPNSCNGCAPFTPAYPRAAHIFQVASTATPVADRPACNYANAPSACVPLDWALVGFVDVVGGMANTNLPGLALAPRSKYHNAGADGADLGANVTAVLAAVAGVRGRNYRKDMAR
jgi:hypothetical protein